MSSSAAAAAESADAGAYAPELPPVLIDHILAPLALYGEVAALCVALCINTSWRDVARQPSMWRHLCNFQRTRKHWGTRTVALTDERLALLVQRATAADGTHHLERLDVTGCRLVTARGVALALRGLEGTLSQLHVAGILSGEEDDDYVMPLLRECMQPGKTYYLDVQQHLLCNAPDVRGLGEPPICSRLCSDTLCEECDIIRCASHHRPSPPYAHSFYGTPPCEHVCSDCGERPQFPHNMIACPACDDEDERRICEDCMSFCHACHEIWCQKKCPEMIACVACGETFCEHCAFQLGHVKMCYLTGAECGDCYCDGLCADKYVKTASAWAAELQTREGDNAVDAGVIARLLDVAARVKDSGEDDGEEQVCCEGCAMRIPPSLSSEEEEEVEQEDEMSLPLAAAE
jgi:hypothetical protein